MAADIEHTEMGWEYAKKITNKLNNINFRECPELDEESTITANEKSKDTYNESQSLLQLLLSAVTNDVNNINTLSENCKNFDEYRRKDNSRESE